METDNENKRKVDKLYHDAYLATGKPGSFVTRLHSLEEVKRDMGTKLDRLNNVLNWAIGLLIATLAGVVVDLCVRR